MVFIFRCILHDNKEFISVMAGVSSIVDEIQLQVDSDGIRGVALDKAHISFIDWDFKLDFFEEFLCDTPLSLNLDTSELMKVLKRAKSNDKIILTTDNGNLIFTFEGEAKRTFKIRLIDIEYETPNKPPLEHPVNDVPVPFALFEDWVKDAELWSVKFRLCIGSDKVRVESVGDFGEMNNEFYHGEKVGDGSGDEREYKSIFSTEKLHEFLKINKVSDNILISLGNDMPLVLKLVNDEVEIGYLLAPRIEADEW